tara:strand:- start:2284 stop:2601 length:318 start_codon:yes stop_codon:yes gene_type:complete
VLLSFNGAKSEYRKKRQKSRPLLALFMVHHALTGRLAGPDVGDLTLKNRNQPFATFPKGVTGSGGHDSRFKACGFAIYSVRQLMPELWLCTTCTPIRDVPFLLEE